VLNFLLRETALHQNTWHNCTPHRFYHPFLLYLFSHFGTNG